MISKIAKVLALSAMLTGLSAVAQVSGSGGISGSGGVSGSGGISGISGISGVSGGLGIDFAAGQNTQKMKGLAGALEAAFSSEDQSPGDCGELNCDK